MSIWEEGQRAAYEAMAPYELADLSYSIREALNTDIFNIFTIISAYLLVAYFAGAKLDRVNVAIVNLVYTVWMATFTFSTFQVAQQLVVVNDVRNLGVTDEAVMLLAFALTLGGAWISSLVFMYRVRRNAAESEGDV
jgi:hypothetical protein